MAQVSRRRRNTSVNQMPLLNLLTEAFNAGTQPQRYRGSNLGIFVQIPSGRKITLVNKNGHVSPAGKIWYVDLHQVEVPKLYQYEQPLMHDMYVTAWDGSTHKVRQRNTDGTWTILKVGEPYFRYNQVEYIVDVPIVKAKERRRDGTYKIIRPITARDIATWYSPLIEMELNENNRRVPSLDGNGRTFAKSVRVGSVRQRTRGGIRPRNLAATEQDQDNEIKATAAQYLAANKTIQGDDGITYIILYYLSEVYFLWDESRAFILHKQRTNFWDDRPPTTETILARPLLSFAVPDGMCRSWDLHEDSFKTFTHGCCVQMLYKSLTKRPGGHARSLGETSRIPMLTVEQIQTKLDEIFTALGYEEGKCPFEAGWRVVGANAHMILRFCSSMNIPCYVHHKENLLTYSAPPNGTKSGQAIVNVSIWGGHCYFYGGDGEKIGRCEMNRIASFKAKDNPQLAYSALKDKTQKENDSYTSRIIEEPFRWEKRPPFSEWRTEFQLVEAMETSFSNISDEFSTKKRKLRKNEDREDEALLFWSTDIEQIYHQLTDLQETWKGTLNAIDIKPCYGADMHSINNLIVKADKCPKIKIKGVPKDAELLNRLSIKITKYLAINSKAFVYRGEALSGWTENLRLLLSKVHRERYTLKQREIVMKKFMHRCAHCDEELHGQEFELDHKQPLCDGGSGDIENIQPLCLPCHAEKCASERLNMYGKQLYSELNIDVLEGLFDAPRPQQIVFGNGASNGIEIDTVKCRRYALEKSQTEFPVACVLDTIVAFHGQLFDFAYVDAGPPKSVSTLIDLMHFCFYGGPGWYDKERFLTATSMEAKNAAGDRICEDHIVCVFTASSSAPKDSFAKIYGDMNDVLLHVLEDEVHPESEWVYTKEHKDQFVKSAILAMQGSWLTQHKYLYNICDSTHTEDAKGKLVSYRDLGGFDGLLRLASRTEILSNRTMGLIGLKTLNSEHMFLGKVAWLLSTIPRVKLCGAIVDCIIVKDGDAKELEEKVARLRHYDGMPISRIKSQKDAPHNRLFQKPVYLKESVWTPNYTCDEDIDLIEKFNSNTYGSWYSNPRFKYERHWDVVIEEEGIGSCDEYDIFQMEWAEKVVKNRGAIILGAGGSGKSRMARYIKAIFEKEGFVVETCAFTHTAAANLDGETILKELHKNAKSKRRVFIVDEASMVSLRLWTVLQSLQFTGAIFIVIGDWAGQLAPISDREVLNIWRHIPTSDFMHQMVNGLSITLSKYRRGTDASHYNLVRSLYPEDEDEDIKISLICARISYPIRPGIFRGTSLCITNKCRVAINERVNQVLAPEEYKLINVAPNPKAAKTPQNMRIWPGIVLLGSCTDKGHVKNAVRYKVLELNTDHASVILVDDEDVSVGNSFNLTFEEIGQKLVLSHAITYDSSQAKTIYGPLRLTQTSHKHMTLRRLIVGLGRAPDGALVEVE